jgi:hypothetical protein
VYRIWVGRPEGKDYLDDPDEEFNIKMDLKEFG